MLIKDLQPFQQWSNMKNIDNRWNLSMFIWKLWWNLLLFSKKLEDKVFASPEKGRENAIIETKKPQRAEKW